MYRVIWLRVGGKKIHLLKLAGAFFVFAAVLMVASATYNIFVTADKASYVNAQSSVGSVCVRGSEDLLETSTVFKIFGWSTSAPCGFSGEDFLGVMLAPVAVFLFWLGIAVVAIMVYQSGRIVFPVEEYEQKVVEHHRKLIEKAVKAKKIK